MLFFHYHMCGCDDVIVVQHNTVAGGIRPEVPGTQMPSEPSQQCAPDHYISQSLVY